jgi:hypothetical protein
VTSFKPGLDQRPLALLVAAFDSQLKWCAGIRDELAARGYRSRAVVPEVRSALSAGQVTDAGFSVVEPVSWTELVDAAADADVVVCGLSGPATRSLVFDLSARLMGSADPGPVIVTGWVGVIIEKITAGYLDRSGSDVVAVNSSRDLAHFRHTAVELGLPTDNLLLAGLPFIGPSPAPPRTEIRRILFADQPTVPTAPAERRYLYDRLLGYARAHPDREVVLKPRHRLDEGTYHTMRYHPENLLAGVPRPPNFAIDYTPISEQLPTVDLLITMSSTACLEALDRGSRVALVADLGVHERYGNHAFLDSGLLRTWRQIDVDAIGSPEPGWLSSFFFPRAGSIADRIEELRASGERPSRAVWASEYFRSAAEVDMVLRPARTPRAVTRLRLLRGAASAAARELLPPLVSRPLRRAVRRVQAGQPRPHINSAS